VLRQADTGSPSSCAGSVEDLADIVGRLKSGDDAASQSFRFLVDHLPGFNPFYVRSALNYLVLYRIQEWLNPGAMKRMERRIAKENGQTFLVPPSTVVR
jgi:hypothetical protein